MEFILPVVGATALAEGASVVGAAVVASAEYVAAGVGAAVGLLTAIPGYVASKVTGDAVMHGMEKYALGPITNGAGFYLAYKGLDAATHHVNNTIQQQHGPPQHTLNRKPAYVINQ